MGDGETEMHSVYRGRAVPSSGMENVQFSPLLVHFKWGEKGGKKLCTSSMVRVLMDRAAHA